MTSRSTRKQTASDPSRPVKPASYRILLALGESEMHGYGIMQWISKKSGGKERMLPGTLYSSLARLVRDGLVEELDPPEDQGSGGPQRRYYRRTELGRELAAAESLRLRALLEIATGQDLLPENG